MIWETVKNGTPRQAMSPTEVTTVSNTLTTPHKTRENSHLEPSLKLHVVDTANEIITNTVPTKRTALLATWLLSSFNLSARNY